MLDYESKDDAQREADEERSRIGSIVYGVVVVIVLALFLLQGVIRFILWF
jgi:hypothetical protein